MPMGEEFRGLPMESLIGAPLKAASQANLLLAKSTSDFIDAVGFNTNKGGNKTVKTAQFSYNVKDKQGDDKQVDLKIPTLSIVQIPSLKVDLIDITFDMEVKSSEEEKSSNDKTGSFSVDASSGWGPVKLDAKVSGSISTHKENTRSTDKSAKYHVQVRATDSGISEGLSRVLDIMNESIVRPPALPDMTSNTQKITSNKQQKPSI